MIDVQNETLLTPNQLTRHPAFRNRNGNPCALAKIYRLFERGCSSPHADDRITLEHILVPGGLRSSQEAVERFIATLNGQEEHLPTHPTPRRRQNEIEAAEAELAGAGML